MAKVTPVLWKHKKNRHGHHPIYLRVADADRTLYRSLKVYIRASHWNPKTERVRKGNSDADDINALIVKKLADAKKAELRLRLADEPVTAEAIRDALIERKVSRRPDYFAYAATVSDEHEARGGVYTARRYRSISNKFAEFAGQPLPFDRITLSFLRDFETHLIKKGNAVNTRASAFRAIKAIIRRAIEEGIVDRADDPFYHFPIKQEKPDKDKLTWSEMKAIEALDLDEGSALWHTRNYFLFSFYCAGVRWGDLCKLRRSNIVPAKVVVDGKVVEFRRLDYRMSKTKKGTPVLLVPQSEAILAHYESESSAPGDWVFPPLSGYDTSTAEKMRKAIASQNTTANGHLKELAEMAGVTTNVSTHIARHSWSDMARRRGFDVYLISQGLGHSGIRTTEHYLSGSDAEALDNLMQRLFEEEEDE